MTLALATLSPWNVPGLGPLASHMAQHALLVVVAAPLLAVGRGDLWLVGALPRPARRRLAPIHRRLRLGLLPAWALATVVFWLWHAPLLYEATLTSELLHGLEHATFLASAWLYWTVVFRGHGLRYGAAALSVFASSASMTLLAVLLLLAPRPWYPAHAELALAAGRRPLEDQQLAALIMWVPMGALLVLVALALVAAWLRQAERRVVAGALGAGRRVDSLVLTVVVILPIVAGCQEPWTAAALTGGDPSHGESAMRKYGCYTCHTIPGVVGARGTVGPPLTAFAGRGYIAGYLPNNGDNLMAWIQHPQRFRWPTAMPDLGVTEADARDIAAYLYTLR
jgi:cytochrome c oxidase assembly factor CtaG